MTVTRHRRWQNRGHRNRATVTVKIFLFGGDGDGEIFFPGGDGDGYGEFFFLPLGSQIVVLANNQTEEGGRCFSVVCRLFGAINAFPSTTTKAAGKAAMW